ncbi:MAG: sugar isomerase domain-containing protein [Opitutaceae bacterium]|nr:sugar isomerase domain-containing protein [Opitutaceae bacterium]
MYLQSIRNLLTHLETTQSGAIREAGAIVAKALLGDGVVYCYEIGHSNQNDFLDRAGGLAAVRPFTFSFTVTDPVPECRKNRPGARDVPRDLEMVRLAVMTSNLRAGDVLLLGSVSGKNRVPVELAKTCREIGVKVIAFTAMAYTSKVESLHPSGKRLFEMADVVIDVGAPYGDAAVKIEGLEINVLPVSGAGAIIAGWAVWEAAIEKMIAAGKPPTVFQSINRAGGPEFYKKMKEQYEARGY